MERTSSFPKQDFEGMACEIWQALDTCLYHAAYVKVYADTLAMRTVGSRNFQTIIKPQMTQAERDALQEDLIVFRSHFSGVLWQLNHLGELLRKAYRRCKQEDILTDAQHDDLVKKLGDDPILREIREYRNMSHEFAGVIVTVHDSNTHEFMAHIFPSLDGKDADREDRPLDEREIQEHELNTKLQAYCDRLGGYCEGLFRLIDAKYRRAVFPRTRGFVVTIPHSYQGGVPQGAKEVIYIQMIGSVPPAA